ncbi:valine--tRNA ligase [Salibacteraceae bacterium]|nr:valine--tRNA ligase [Salibacteraceae bacterium]MDC1220264.1 valine--tRNA ligase [bacterium]
MSDLSTKYSPSEVEGKWYKHWMEKGFFSSKPDPDKEPFTIVIPPPNVTGVLHMGHMLNNTIQDILIRKARLEGKNACWVPGMDHASIATEAKVVKRLREKGIKKSDLSREEFLSHAWDWKEEYGGVILQQLKKLGASCDWDRTRFTMDEKFYESVIDTFIHLHDIGLIYRGLRMVNWDPEALTAVSDEEVIYTEEQSKLYHLRYKIEGSEEYVTIATTRPETILGDSAICIHPEDERYNHLHGKRAIVPLVNRSIPIILDEYVDREFGTGCLKVTPAHDTNDYDLGQKHNLETIDILNANGTLSEAAQILVGVDRFEARKQIGTMLEEAGSMVKVESYDNKVGRSERTNSIIEPRLSLQWFVEMKTLAEPALDAVENGEIKFHPAKFNNTYRHWMTNIKDWCISRQLWWGHRIPAWYFGEGDANFVVAKNAEEALSKAKAIDSSITAKDLRQDEDVMDTWFSSWLWPISVFDGFYDRKELDYYYPTNDLVTGPDIIFFWVARMIMAGYEFEGKRPFKNVYFTGIIRDKLGRKMSKSLGNSPDPIDLIEKYSADGVRLGLLMTAPAGNDIPFDDSICEQGRNFTNKIWNALRLIKGWSVEDKAQPEVNKVSIDWLNQRIAQETAEINDHYIKYRLNDAAMSLYKLVWDEFCSWYLEAIKPAYGDSIDRKTYNATLDALEKLMIMLHPMMPFITEEVYHSLRERSEEDCIIVAPWPQAGKFDVQAISDFETAKQIITEVRSVRAQKNLSPRETLGLIQKGEKGSYSSYELIISKLANVDLKFGESANGPAASFIIGTEEFAVPLEGMIDTSAEISKLEEELKYQQGFLNSVMKKLSNERFVSGAPEQVVAAEQKKRDDAESRITSIKEQLVALK